MTTALVIDDNRDMADTLGRMLSLLNVDAKIAYGPQAGMIMIKNIQPDIVFLDISIPGVNGFEVMSDLQRFPNMQNIPVVFVTVDGQPETAGKVRNTGALLIIIKPVTFESLENALRKAGLLK